MQVTMRNLVPGSPLHTTVLAAIVKRLEASERKMVEFHARWTLNERKVQAYVNLPDYERLVKETNDKKSTPPKVVNIVVSYSWATVQTITTYLLHTFCGRSPMFQVGTYNGELAENARNLETILQYNVSHTKLINALYQGLLCTQIYQVGVWRIGWKTERRFRTVRTTQPRWSFVGLQVGQTEVKNRQQYTTYSGNDVDYIDPFLFFPDPRVPMSEVNRRGEYVFWRSFNARIHLQDGQAQGWYQNVDAIPVGLPENREGLLSDRAIRSGGEAIAGGGLHENRDLPNSVQIDEGTVLLIPKEWGLGDGTVPEKWLFTVANKKVILRAEPLEADHDIHPVAVVEPNLIGKSFGALATADIVGPIQDHISWLLNSHMQNVRGAINNRLIVNPHFIHMEDLKKDPTADDGAWLVRMKQSALGAKPEDGLYQMAVADVTGGHIKSIETMMRFGQMLTGTNENIMGMQDSRGRKTATEVRTSGEAGASRLAAAARIISAQGISDIPMMMGTNLQQRLDFEFYNRVIGQKKGGVPLSPDSISGDFYYPIHDGTLPLDRVALAGVWKEILMGVAQDQQLRMMFDFPKIFSFVADLAGAGNIDSFRVQMQPQAQVEDAAAAGKVVPLMPGMPVGGAAMQQRA